MIEQQYSPTEQPVAEKNEVGGMLLSAFTYGEILKSRFTDPLRWRHELHPQYVAPTIEENRLVPGVWTLLNLGTMISPAIGFAEHSLGATGGVITATIIGYSILGEIGCAVKNVIDDVRKVRKGLLKESYTTLT